jgi:uncharacterized damage-inducible protein DinB
VAEDKDQLLQHYKQMREDLLSAIEGLSDELISEPSLDGWSVKDHLAHLAFWDDLRASEVARISAGHDPVWNIPDTDDQVETLNALVSGMRRGLSAGQAKWELQTSRQRVEDAISSATERGLDASLYGDPALRSTHEVEHTEWIKRWRADKGV